MSASCLYAEGLKKAYGSRTVVENVALTLNGGEVVGLLGPNGAGKTTTFYMMVGLIRPDGGQVIFDKTDITQLPMHARARMGLGYLPQETSVFRGLTVLDNLNIYLETLDITPREVRRRRQAILAELGIEHLRNSRAFTLSGGERRRVEIGRALCIEPKFILLDEPFAGIDPLAVSDLQELIGGLRERGIGVLITDHNWRETLGICDRAYILDDGHVCDAGTPDHIVSSEIVQQVYLGKQTPQ